MGDAKKCPVFIIDEIRYQAHMAEVIVNCEILKISIEDLDWISPKNQPRKRGALNALKQGLELFLTLGSKGVKVYNKKEPLFTCPGPQITVGLSLDAGDAFNTGLVVRVKRPSALSHSAVLALSQMIPKKRCVFPLSLPAIRHKPRIRSGMEFQGTKM